MNLQINSASQGHWAATPRNLDEADYFTIGDMARTFKVSLRALRFYEDRGLLKPDRHGFVRLYDAKQRSRLKLILKGKRLGFTLTGIMEMLKKHNDSEPLDFEETLEPLRVATQIEELERKRSGLDIAIQELRATQARLVGERELAGEREAAATAA
jgi:DNA-binding transcriptional MerR regulator